MTSELLNHRFEMPARPSRVVSLLASATETIEAVGRAESVIGISEYCDRYVDLDAPVVGQYTSADVDTISDLEPDLVVVTSGIQAPLARRMVKLGLPVYAVPLPGSIHGVLENTLTVAALVGAVPEGRSLIEAMRRRLNDTRPDRRYRTYAEIWFGRHVRTPGGRTFIADIIDLAGGDGLFVDDPLGYLEPDLASVADLAPEVVVGFSEPEYPVDFPKVIEERGWAVPHLIESTVRKGRNIIHDGPSIVETTEWLAAEFAELD